MSIKITMKVIMKPTIQVIMNKIFHFLQIVETHRMKYMEKTTWGKI